MNTSFVISRRLLLLTGISIVALGAAGVAITYLPAAVIIVKPTVKEASVTQLITLSTEGQPDYVRFTLPVKMAEAELEEVKTVTREGANVRDEFAKGQVTLVNNLEEEQQLLPRTHLKHEAAGIYFLTDAPVALPPNSKTAMAVTAKEKGAPGNVPAGKFLIDKLPPSVQTAVFGESTSAFTGGVAVESPLTEEEIVRAKEVVSARLKERLTAELSTKTGGAFIRPDLQTVTIELEEVSAQAGSTTQEFRVMMRGKGQALLVNDTDLLSLTLVSLRKERTDDGEFVAYAPESFQVKLQRADFSRGRAVVEASLTGTFSPKIEPSLFRSDNLAGRTKAEVQEYFTQFSSVGSVEVQFSPFWVSRVPAREKSVEIRIAE